MIRIANNQTSSLRRRSWSFVSTTLNDYSSKLNVSHDGNDNGKLSLSSACRLETTIDLSQKCTKFGPYQRSPFLTTSRHFSSSVKDNNDGTFYDLNNGSNLPTFEESLSTLSGSPIGESDVADNAEIVDAVTSATSTFEPVWYSPPDQAINLVQFVHDASGLEYAACIFAITIALRSALFPLMAISQRNMSRLAHMKPEMDVISGKMQALNSNSTMEERTRLQRQYYALMQKYECNPLKSVAVMLAQFPVFIGMFLGLKKMPEYFDVTAGGYYWFTDLTVADPYYILPCITAATFIAGVEVNKELTIASNPQQGPIMINAMRGLGLLMIPATGYFPSIVFCYWVANNSFTFVQMMAFKQPALRNLLGIWEAPKPVPGQTQKGMQEMYTDWSENRAKENEEKEKKEKILEHNKRVAKRRTRRFRN